MWTTVYPTEGLASAKILGEEEGVSDMHEVNRVSVSP